MTTQTLESTQLSNNTIQPFKFNLDQTLDLKNINIIARKEDGYINLNQLCQAGNKEFSEWKRSKKSKAFLEVLSATLGIPRVELIKYNEGGNGERHNWGHPQVAINVAQWISPEFDVKVSKWIYELMITGSVTLGQEKTNQELEEKYQEQISTFVLQLSCN